MRAVEALMQDGVNRIDEEIWRGCRTAGYISSYSTVRHGRLTLSEAGILVDTGNVRLTSDNAPSIVWGLNPNPPDIGKPYTRSAKPTEVETMSFQHRPPHNKESTTCTARVWANGDCEDCGRKTLRKGLCDEHLKGHVDALLLERKKLQAELATVESELWDHQHESG